MSTIVPVLVSVRVKELALEKLNSAVADWLAFPFEPVVKS